MTPTKKEDISALMDDALDNGAIPDVVDALATEPELQEAWVAYALTGAALRSKPTPMVDVTGAVMEDLAADQLASGSGRQEEGTEDQPQKPRKPLSL